MTAILKEVTSNSQTLLQGVPSFKGRAVIAYGNAGRVGQHGVITNNPTGVFDDGGENTGFGYWAENRHQLVAMGMAATFFGPFDASSSVGLIDDGYYATYDAIDSAVFRKQNILAYDCGSVEIGVNPFEDPDVLSGLFILASSTMETYSGYVTYAPGDVAVTGLGFRPDLILFTRFGHNSFGDPGVHIGQMGVMSVGAADGHGNQWAVGVESVPYQGAGARSTTTSASKIAVRQDIWPTVSHVSMDADGFTLNWSGVDSDIIQYWAIHDPEGEFKVGMGLDGDSSISPGFKPDNVLFAAGCNTVLEVSQNFMVLGIGGCDNQLNQLAGWAAAAQLAPSGNNFRSHYWNTSAIAFPFDRASPLTNGKTEATATAFTTGGVNLSWVNALGTRYFCWAAMKTGRGPSFDGCGQTVSFDFSFSPALPST